MNHTKIGIIGVAIALLVIVGAVFILQGSVSPTGSSEDTCTYTKSGDEDLGCAVVREKVTVGSPTAAWRSVDRLTVHTPPVQRQPGREKTAALHTI